MANLKVDLINKINNQKYFQELELARLSNEANMNYEAKITEIETILGQLVILNAELGIIEQYYKEPEAQDQVLHAAQPVANNGQSHNE
jgi:hypothetical protein